MNNRLITFLRSSKIFLRYLRQKRKNRYLRAFLSEQKRELTSEILMLKGKLSEVEKKHVTEIEFLKEAYENKIYIERYRADSISKELTDRVLQLAGSEALFYSQNDAPSSPVTEAKQARKLKKEQKHEQEIALKDIKSQFWEDGIAEGASLEEIEHAWEGKREEIYNSFVLEKHNLEYMEDEQ